MTNLPSNQEIQALFRNIAYDIGNNIRREFERSGDYTKHGIQYPNLPNRSSTAYESPAKQSGRLHSNIDVEFDENSSELKVGSNVSYLKYLELGTAKMQPRQGLKQAYENTNIIEIIDNKIQMFFR